MSDAILSMFGEIYLSCVASHRVVLLLGPTGSGKTAVANCLHVGRNRIREARREKTNAGYDQRLPQPKPGPVSTEGETKLPAFIRWQAGRSQGADSLAPRSEWVGFAPKSGYNAAPINGSDGLLKQSAGATIFVDEFAQLSRDLQVFLLDATEGQPVTPLGPGGVPFVPDVHYVFATNEGVEGIRPELRHRINATIRVPALAERIEDVFPLVKHFLKKTNYCLDFRTWLLLLSHSWPGNIRELKNIVDRAVTRMRVERPESDKPACSTLPTAASPTLAVPPQVEPWPKAAGEPKRVAVPFELFSREEELAEVAEEMSSVTESEAIPRVISYMETVLRAQGYEEGKRNWGLSARIAQFLEVSPTWVTNHRKPDDA